MLVGAGACGPAPRPNVLLLSIDTLRADHPNVYGYRNRAVSPAIDALAADAIVFEHHVAAAPWTTPSHMSLLTSLNPSAHGVTSPMTELTSPAAPRRTLKTARVAQTLASALSGAG